ncbi:MAG TPA: gliding motility-associated C-terminal domain-containing protein [Cytophagaceae bacterium]
MNELKNIELITNYERGELSEAERSAFHQRLQSDTDFNNLYQDYLQSVNLLKIKELCDVHKELEKYDYNGGNFFSNNKQTIAVSFAGIMLAGALAFYFLKPSDNPKESIHSASSLIYGDETEDNIVNTIPAIEPANVSSGITAIQPKTISRPKEEVINDLQLILDTIQAVVDNSEIDIEPDPINVNEEDYNVVTPKFDCTTDNIRLEYETDPSCKDIATGSINIKRVIGKASSYSITMSGKDSYKNSARFTGLSGGVHTIIISDNNNCVNNYSIELKSIECADPFADNTSKESSDFILYLPGETWKIPMEAETQLVEIKNQQGILVYQKTISMSDSEEWNGHGMNGNPLSSGIYYYTIKGFNNSKVRTGTITIVNY